MLHHLLPSFPFTDATLPHLQEGQAKIAKIRKLGEIAKRLNTSQASLALAWAANNPNVSTVLLGATKPEQIVDNLEALKVLPKLTPEILQEIEDILDNKPKAAETYGR